MKGLIFDIKEFSVHDGPGCRVTVFLKGCPLRCRWCHNPEGLSAAPELLFRKNKCVHCGKCMIKCDHPECRPYGRCLHICPNHCLSIAGKWMESEELADRLSGYRDFLKQTGGGITFSGGEPLLWADFLKELTGKLPGIHKAIQTSGYVLPSVYREMIPYFDYVMQDIKLADPHASKEYTGCDNGRIIENVRYLKESGIPYVFRVPLIPEITDTEENLKAIARIVGDSPVELLPYNTMAGAKYEMTGRTYSLTDQKNREEDFTRFFQNAVIS